jgi:hypothetical protein
VTVPTTLTAVADTELADPVLADALAEVGSGRLPTGEITGPQAMRPFVVKGLVDADRTVLAVTATSREAEDLTAELSSLLDPETVAYYPSWETLPHERLSPRSDTVGRPLAAALAVTPMRSRVPIHQRMRRLPQGSDREPSLQAPGWQRKRTLIDGRRHW